MPEQDGDVDPICAPKIVTACPTAPTRWAANLKAIRTRLKEITMKAAQYQNPVLQIVTCPCRNRRRIARARRGVRRVPHRFALPRSRSAHVQEAAADSRPRNFRHGGRVRRWGNREVAGGIASADSGGVTCGACAACRMGRENICENMRMPGNHMDGGYAGIAVPAKDGETCPQVSPGRVRDHGRCPIHALAGGGGAG